MILRARQVLPICAPPIENGCVCVRHGLIERVGPAGDTSPDPAEECIDLGDVLLLPGLINAHCHLDYTDMAGQLVPGRSFTDWIKSITALKATWSYTEFAASWIRGAAMLVDSGTTTVGDIEAVPELLPDAWASTPLRVISFFEMTGVKSRRDPAAILSEAVRHIERLPRESNGAGLSPHAPYSTTPNLLRLCAGTSAERDWPIACHVAESATEFDMFQNARGEMHDWLRRNDRDMSDCGGVTPLAHLTHCGLLGPRTMLIHGNYLTDDDTRAIADARSSVVHCPRSHRFFQHRTFPFETLRDAGVNLCLGTDSLATVIAHRGEATCLDLFREMREFLRVYPGTSPEEVVRMVTLNPAKALGYEGRLGALKAGAIADLIAVPSAGNAAQAYEAVVQHQAPVVASMIRGVWARLP